MRLLPITNYQLQTRKKAFTLMEILIAASIFAIVMVIATGILGQSSSFRGKIKAQRESSEDAKKIADMISRDVREATGPVTVNLDTNPIVSKTYSGGIVLQKVTLGSTAIFKYFSAPFDYSSLPTTNPDANTLIIATKSKIIIYANINSSIYRKAVDYSSPGIFNMADIAFTFLLPENKINSSNVDTAIFFGGYSPATTSTNLQQPYLQFILTCQTKGYSSLSPNSRAIIEIRSTVTARNFAN